jgi:DNA-binding NtrC family response regulator
MEEAQVLLDAESDADRGAVKPEALPDLLPVLLRRECVRLGVPECKLGAALTATLVSWSWPGGREELRLRVALAALLGAARGDDEPLRLEDFGLTATEPTLMTNDIHEAKAFAEWDFKRRFFTHYLEQEEGFVNRAAKRMNMPRPSLSTMLGKVGLDPADFKRRARRKAGLPEFGKRKSKSKRRGKSAT